MTALDQRRGDDLSEPTTLALPVQALLEQGILTPTAFNVGAVVKLTERSNEDDLTRVPEFIRWAAIGSWLGGISGAVKWWIGDWLAFGEGAWGERYAQAAEATGLDIGTLQNYAYVCRQVLPSRRRPELSFTSHLKVAKLNPPEQKAWLDHAIKHNLRSKELEAAIRENGGKLPGRRHTVDETAELEQRPRGDDHQEDELKTYRVNVISIGVAEIQAPTKAAAQRRARESDFDSFELQHPEPQITSLGENEPIATGCGRIERPVVFRSNGG